MSAQPENLYDDDKIAVLAFTDRGQVRMASTTVADIRAGKTQLDSTPLPGDSTKVQPALTLATSVVDAAMSQSLVAVTDTAVYDLDPIAVEQLIRDLNVISMSLILPDTVKVDREWASSSATSRSSAPDPTPRTKPRSPSRGRSRTPPARPCAGSADQDRIVGSPSAQDRRAPDRFQPAASTCQIRTKRLQDTAVLVHSHPASTREGEATLVTDVSAPTVLPGLEAEPRDKAALDVVFAARTHVGLVRSENQDAVVVDGWLGQATNLGTEGRAHLSSSTWTAAVLDGMGGYAGGALASLLCAATFAASLRDCKPDQPAEQYAAAYQEASTRVAQFAKADPELARMGSTAAAVVVGEDGYAVTNVGDARIYRLWQGQFFAQLSVDDRLNDHDHTITQVLGPQSTGAPDVHYYRLPHDGSTVLLIASDGLTDYVPGDQIKAVLQSLQSSPEIEDVGAVTDLLIAAALRAGAPDNITVVVATLVAGEQIGAEPS